MLDEIAVTHLQVVHVWVECMIYENLFLIIEEYYIVSWENAKPRGKIYFGMTV